MYEVWCERHHSLEVAWIQAADREEALAARRGASLVAAPDLVAAQAEVIRARNAMLAAGCPGHSGHAYDSEIRAIMRKLHVVGAARRD